MIGFKTTDDYTFDECLAFLTEHDDADSSWKEINDRYHRLLTLIQNEDESAFNMCKTSVDYNNYLNRFQNIRGAINYAPIHKTEAEEYISTHPIPTPTTKKNPANTIKLPYSPSITNEYIMDVLRQDYPDKKVSKFLNQIRVKQNSLRGAQIFVIHNEKKNFTKINVSVMYPLWISVTFIFPILFFILAPNSLCDWVTEVTEKLKTRVENPLEKRNQKI